jgi:hypothetical protein
VGIGRRSYCWILANATCCDLFALHTCKLCFVRMSGSTLHPAPGYEERNSAVPLAGEVILFPLNVQR